jgi:ADP-ribose pyrophosphatase
VVWDGTHYRPFTYRKARKSLKTGHSPRTRFAWRCQIQLKLAALAYAIGSGPVYWVGPAAKSGQQLVGRIGDNPCMVGDFGVRHNANDGEFASGTAELSQRLSNATKAHGMVPPFELFSAQERRMGMLQLWKTLNREPLFSGGPIKEIARETVLLPDGRVIPDYYTAVMGDYAIVYALTQGGNVLILRQYKHGPRRVCLTFPGGHVDPGENPADGIVRELLEETGYRAGRWTPLGSFVANANQACNTAHLFRADGCWRDRDPEPGDLEEMELLEMTPADLLRPERFAEMAVLPYVALALLASRVTIAGTHS